MRMYKAQEIIKAQEIRSQEFKQEAQELREYNKNLYGQDISQDY